MTFPPLGEKGGNLYLIEPKAGAQVSPGPLGILAGCYFQEGLPLDRETGAEFAETPDGERALGALGLNQI